MRFSVIIPVYNKANTICESIDSVLSQPYKGFELIVVNDGSSDNIIEILKKYKNKIKILNQKNSGVSVARNNGIKASKGEYICFLDADDIWFENHLFELDRLIKKYNNSFYITSHIVTDGTGKEIYSNINLNGYKKDFINSNLIDLVNKNGDSIIHTNNICVKKEFLVNNNIFFEPNVKIGEDTDMWYRISLYSPVVLSKETTTMYKRENSTATKKTSNTFDWIFAKRYKGIINDSSIDESIKESYKQLIDRYNLSCSRDYIMQNDRKNAIKRLKMISNKSGKKYYLTKLFCHIPYPLAHIVYKFK